MQIALIADSFPPLRTSGAVQLRDLSREFVRQGHALTVLLPSCELTQPWALENLDGVRVLRLKAPRTRDIDYVRRTVGEFAMPFSMLRNLRKSPLTDERWDALVWYSPSIFHGPLVSALKKSSACRSYLIIRDIFPEWALDMGLMGRGLPYRFFAAVARYQYSVADVIGVQSPGNLRYFASWQKQPERQLQVLHNWLQPPEKIRCSIRIDQTPLAGRKVLVYAGNMGVAQGIDVLLDLAERLKLRPNVGLLFVGRGSESARLKVDAQSRQLDNVLFLDEIDPDEIPDLYAQCVAGLVALHPKHKSHNIPGKFLTYMQNGLPVLANINAGNDLAQLIKLERIGQVCESNHVEDLARLCVTLLQQIDGDVDLTNRCKRLFARDFAVKKTVEQIVSAL